MGLGGGKKHVKIFRPGVDQKNNNGRPARLKRGRGGGAEGEYCGVGSLRALGGEGSGSTREMGGGKGGKGHGGRARKGPGVFEGGRPRKKSEHKGGSLKGRTPADLTESSKGGGGGGGRKKNLLVFKLIGEAQRKE